MEAMKFLVIIFALLGSFEKARWGPNGGRNLANSEKINAATQGIHSAISGHVEKFAKVKTVTTFYGLSKRRDRAAASTGTLPTLAKQPKSVTKNRPASTPAVATMALSVSDIPTNATAASLKLTSGTTEVVRMTVTRQGNTLTVSNPVPATVDVFVNEAAADGTLRVQAYLPNTNVSFSEEMKPLAVFSELTTMVAGVETVKRQGLGDPRASLEVANARGWGVSRAAGIDIVGGGISQTYEDFSVPYFTGEFAFRRTYLNQYNEVSGLGVGWTHNFEGKLFEEITESKPRYDVVIEGQDYGFTECDWNTGNTCENRNQRHGGTLKRVTQNKKSAFIFNMTNGQQYLFATRPPYKDLPIVVIGAAPAESKPLRREWLLEGISDGHGIELTDTQALNKTLTANWWKLKYEDDATNPTGTTGRLLTVERVGQPLELAFTWDNFKTGTTAEILGQAKAFSQKRISNVAMREKATPTNILYSVVLQHDNTRHNLSSAIRSGEGGTREWKYEYVLGAGTASLQTGNELKLAQYFEDGVKQRESTFGHRTTKPFEWVQAEEAYATAKHTGMETAVTVEGSEGNRTIKQPTGETTIATVNVDLGVVTESKTGTSKLTTPWFIDGELLKPGVIKNAVNVEVESNFDNQLRPTNMTLLGSYAGQPLLTGLVSKNEYLTPESKRFGVPSKVTAEVAQPTNISLTNKGDIQSVTSGLGNILTVTNFTTAGLAQQMTDSQGRVIEVTEFDTKFGTPKTVTTTLAATSATALGSYTTKTDRDDWGRVTSVKQCADTNCGTVLSSVGYTYDGQGRVEIKTVGPGTAAIGPTSYTTNYLRTSLGIVATQTCSAPHLVKQIFQDGLLRSSEESLDFEGDGAKATRVNEYENGRLKTTTDARLAKVTPQYSTAEGFVEKVTATKATETIQLADNSLDAEGNASANTDALGVTTTPVRDGLARSVGVNAAAGSFVKTTLKAGGAVDKSTDGTRESTVTTRDADGNPTTITLTGGATITQVFDTAKRLTNRTDEFGNTSEYQYKDVLGRITKHIQNTSGSGTATTEYAYVDEAGKTTVTETTTAGSRVEKHKRVMDSRGWVLAEIEYPNDVEATTTFTYDTLGRRLSRTRPGGHTATWKYDAAGRMREFKDEENYVTKYSYDGEGLLTRTDGPLQNQYSTNEYDAARRLTKHIESRIAGLPLETKYEYPGGGKVKVTDAEGYVHETTVNALGQAIQRVDGINKTTISPARVTTLTYDGTLPATEIIAEGSWQRSKSWQWDGRGLPTGNEVDAWTNGALSYNHISNHAWAGTNGLTETLTHNWGVSETKIHDGNLKLLSRSMGGVTDVWVYDAMGKLKTFTSADATNPHGYEYFQDGQAKKESFGTSFEDTIFGYEARGLLASVLTPDGRTQTNSYNPRGLLESQRYGMGANPATTHAMTFGYDAAGRMNSRLDEGALTTFSNGHQGELRSVTQATAGSAWSYEFDALNRLTKVTPPAGGSVSQTFTFDGLGRRTSKYLGQLSHWNSVWANNVETMTTPMQDRVVNYIDGRGRIARTTQSPSTESQPSTDAIFSYDGFDARTNILESRRGVQQLFAYDNAHRLTGVSRDGESVTYGGFGATRNGTTMKHGAQTTTYGYDAATGRINSVSGIFSATAIPIAFEAGGQRLTRIGDEKYCFNDKGWMDKIGPDCANPTRSYGFDARGNRISETANLLTRNFTYDIADRLTSATEWNQQLTTYSLNPDGTRNTEVSGGVTKTYNYLDGRGGLTNVTWATGIDSYIWDNAGRLKTATTAAGVRTFEFDSRDRVTKVNNINIESDALGMRRRAVDGPSIRTWTYGGEDGESLSAEGADLLTRVNGFAVAQGNTNFTQRDALGSVLKQQAGAANSAATFSAFGKRSGTSLTSIGYTGQPNEGDDLVWTGVRPYMPSTGMFVALDEMGAGNFIGTPNELNPHSYGRGNPMRYTDPTGLRAATAEEAQTLAFWNSLASSREDFLSQASSFRRFISFGAKTDVTVLRRASRLYSEAIERAADGEDVTAVAGEAGLNEERAIYEDGQVAARVHNRGDFVTAGEARRGQSQAAFRSMLFSPFAAGGYLMAGGGELGERVAIAGGAATAIAMSFAGVREARMANENPVMTRNLLGPVQDSMSARIEDVVLFPQRVGEGGLVPQQQAQAFYPRHAELGEGVAERSLQQLREGALHPGQDGVVLTDSTIRFSDVYSFSEQLGVEVALTRELVGSSQRYVLRSGSNVNVRTGYPEGPNMSRVVAHTHLPNIQGAPRFFMQSQGDMNALNDRYMQMLLNNPRSAPPMSRVVWGPSSEQQTFFGPSDK
jgi:large repetitive protein